MHLTVVRHGETEENVEQRVQGQLPGKLTELGKRQAAELAERLEDHNFDYIYCSDLKRCKDTAKYIAAKRPDIHIKFTPSLREINFGSFQGKLVKELDWDSLPGDFYNRRPGEGETVLELEDRVVQFINELFEKYPVAHLLIVTHGGPMKIMRSVVDDVPLDKAFNEYIENTALWEFEVSGKLDQVRN